MHADNSTVFHSTSDPISSRLNASNSTIYKVPGGHTLDSFEHIFQQPRVPDYSKLPKLPGSNFQNTRTEFNGPPSVVHATQTATEPVKRRPSALHQQVIASGRNAQSNRDTLTRHLNLTPRYSPY